MRITSNESGGLAVTAYAGDRTVLLAFDLPKDQIGDLAGFAIAVSEPDKALDTKRPYYLMNRLNFQKGVTGRTPYDDTIWTPSIKAPFQSFHWAHYPSLGRGVYTYKVTAMYFGGDPFLKSGPSVVVTADLQPFIKGALELGFTRTMISSQAYTKEFQNRSLHPNPQTIQYDTAGYEKQYVWLGAHARELILAFLTSCRNEKDITLDVFAYDLNEPDIVRGIAALGSRARVFQDNSKDHCRRETDVLGMQHKSAKTAKEALEPEAVRLLRAGGVEVKTGHFGNLSHNKVMIKRNSNKAISALTGSANFTIRGLYVQANSVLVFNDPDIAALYARAFDKAWNSPDKFRQDEISKQWHELILGGARYAFSFAPHSTSWPLDRVRDAINDADRSVLFAMMQMNPASGVSIDALKGLPEREDIYSMGVVQHKGDIGLFKPDTGEKNFTLASVAYLKNNVPSPFKEEMSGGSGQVIHHKLVVCDFNGKNPVVFCGSSNLTDSGEEKNSDNLIAIYDPDVAVMFAVETIRQYDHFRFRSRQEGAKKNEPIILKDTDTWARQYYEKGNIYFRERQALMAQ